MMYVRVVKKGLAARGLGTGRTGGVSIRLFRTVPVSLEVCLHVTDA